MPATKKKKAAAEGRRDNAPKKRRTRRGPSSTARLQEILGKPSSLGTMGYVNIPPRSDIEKRHARCMKQTRIKRMENVTRYNQYVNSQKSAHKRTVYKHAFAQKPCETCDVSFEAEFPWSECKQQCTACYISDKYAAPVVVKYGEASTAPKPKPKKSKEGKWCPCDRPECKKKQPPPPTPTPSQKETTEAALSFSESEA